MISSALSFVIVVKAGSFSAAAKIMGISKAKLSRNVRELEEALGIQLLYRTTRSIALTESGKQFFLSCQDIEENYNVAVDSLKQDFHSIQGTIRITAPISFGSEILPEIIHKFSKHYPNIKIILNLSSTTENLVGKNFDLAIRISPSLPDSSLRMRTLMELELVLCASPNYFKGIKIPINIKDMQEHKFITSVNRNPTLSKIYWSFYRGKKIIKFIPNGIIEVDSLRAQIKLLLQGAGIGKIPRIFIEEELKSGRLIEVLPSIKQQKSQVFLLYPNSGALPKRTQLFIEFIKELLPPSSEA